MTIIQRMAVMFKLTVLIVVGAGLVPQVAVGAQTTSFLSKITAEQILKLVNQPATAVYEPPAECDDPKNPNCSDIDRSKAMLTVDDDGNPQIERCGEMRLFRFAGLKYLNLLAAICQEGRFTLPELNETKARAQRLTEVVTGGPQPKIENSPFNRIRDSRIVSMNDGASAHIFTILAGLGFLPTAVVASPQKTSTFVLQLLILPEPQSPTLMDLVVKSNDTMESLVKELYATTR